MQADVIREPPVHPLQVAHQAAQARRPVDGQRHVAAPHRKGLQHAGQSQEVVGVVVGQEDVLHVRQPHAAQQLALRPLAAIDQHAVAAAPHQHAGRGALDGRHRAGRAEEQDGEIHGRLSSLTGRGIIARCPRLLRARTSAARRMYDVWHSGDLPRILEFLDPEFEYVNPDYAVEPGTRTATTGSQGDGKPRELLRAPDPPAGGGRGSGGQSALARHLPGTRPQRSPDRGPGAAPLDTARRQGPAHPVVPRRDEARRAAGLGSSDEQ